MHVKLFCKWLVFLPYRVRNLKGCVSRLVGHLLLACSCLRGCPLQAVSHCALQTAACPGCWCPLCAQGGRGQGLPEEAALLLAASLFSANTCAGVKCFLTWFQVQKSVCLGRPWFLGCQGKFSRAPVSSLCGTQKKSCSQKVLEGKTRASLFGG